MNWATVGCLAQLGDKAQSLSKDRGGGRGSKVWGHHGLSHACFFICWGLHSVFEYSWSSTCLAHFNPHNMQRYLIPNGAKSSCILVALRGQCPNSIHTLLTTDPSIFTLSQRFHITEGFKLVHGTTLMYKRPTNKSKGRWITRHHI